MRLTTFEFGDNSGPKNTAVSQTMEKIQALSCVSLMRPSSLPRIADIAADRSSATLRLYRLRSRTQSDGRRQQLYR
jgi:hypothetical protein